MTLDPDEQAVVDTVRAFVERDVKPVVRELEPADTYPEVLIARAASSPRARSRGRGGRPVVRERDPVTDAPGSAGAGPGRRG